MCGETYSVQAKDVYVWLLAERQRLSCSPRYGVYKIEQSMLFDVPVLPDKNYIEFLNSNSRSIYACHFGLDLNDVHDSRHRFVDMPAALQLVDLLRQLAIPRKYLLVNSRIQEPGNYLTKGALHRFIQILENFIQENVLDGIVVADFYFLQRLSNENREIALKLEAVPSANCMIDSFDKLLAVHDLIEETHFKPPGKIILDRSLNRKPGDLAATSEQCRARFPEVKLVLLANEGCLYQCPFKFAHDCIISITRMGASLDTFRLNEELGCVHYLQRHPSHLFKSPFIRPEDVDFYSDRVDVLKICGRTLGPDFLKKTIAAYVKNSFDGNLLELLDAMEWATEFLHVANQDLPLDFRQQLTACSKECSSCSYCQLLLDSCSKKRELQIRKMMDKRHLSP